MLIYHFFLFKMQIRSDCNALNIAGNPIKDINVNLSFLSLGSKVVEWTPLTQHENFWNFTFACTVQWCMIICHKWFFHQLLKIQIWNPIKDINVNLSFLSLESKVVEWTHRTYKIWNLEQLKYVTDVEPLYRSME